MRDPISFYDELEQTIRKTWEADRKETIKTFIKMIILAALGIVGSILLLLLPNKPLW